MSHSPSPDLLKILRDPLAVQQADKYGDDPGQLTLHQDSWLISNDTGLKYPIRDGIPVMLIEEGMKWKETAVADLPVPPPSPIATQSIPAPDPQGMSMQQTSSSKAPYIAIALVVIAIIIFLRRSGGNE